MNYRKHFEGKKITLMGLGLLGRGVGDARFLAENGADLIVTDSKSEEELKSSVDELKHYPNIDFHLGGHEFEDFRGRDLIIKGAQVPLRNPYIEEAQKWEVPVTMSTALVAKLSPAITIGITGTKGKSTVTHLIHHIISEHTNRVHLGGNVRGVSTLELLPKIMPGDVLVLELDSWQLQGFGYENISPFISIFTNLMPDHLNYYKGDMDLYFNDKANIYRFQKKGDHLITSDELRDRIEKEDGRSGSIHTPRDFSMFSIPNVETLPGDHNKENIAFAIKTAEILGIKMGQIHSALKSFKGLEGRLQKLKTHDDVQYYNDNNATVPSATIAGLKTLSEKGNVILISGGNYKDVDPKDLAEAIPKYARGLVLIPGTGTDELLKYRMDVPTKRASSLKEAVYAAKKNARPGDIILFSPAFASFGMFRNEYERGDLYKSIVDNLD